MSTKPKLKLFPPGIRGKCWTVRGTIDGKRIEESTNATEEKAARIYCSMREAQLLSAISDRAIITYGDATHRYLEKRISASKHESEMHLKIVKQIGKKQLHEITSPEAKGVAEHLYAGAKASTKNRWVIRLISGVMHHASDEGHCVWVRFKKFREDKPLPRSVSEKQASLIISTAAKQPNGTMKSAICLWMFKHGNRISEIVSVNGKDINFAENTFKLHLSKTNEWRVFALDPEVKRALRSAFGKKLPDGKIWPWGTRWSVYKWLRPMCKAIKVDFTPHAARHSLGTWYAAEGASLRATMTRLGHSDVKSSMRYQNEDMKATVRMNKRIGKLGG